MGIVTRLLNPGMSVFLLVAIEEAGIDGLGGIISRASGRVENRIDHLFLADRRREEVHVMDVREVLKARQNGTRGVVPLAAAAGRRFCFRTFPQIGPSSNRPPAAGRSAFQRYRPRASNQTASRWNESSFLPFGQKVVCCGSSLSRLYGHRQLIIRSIPRRRARPFSTRRPSRE